MRFVLAALLALGFTSTASAADYYFAASGVDGGACTLVAPCQSLGFANTLVYNPGDTINFNRGDTFLGCLGLDLGRVPSGGDRASPIIIQSYGSGVRATFQANCTGINSAGITIYQLSGIIARDLRVISDPSQVTTYGVSVVGNNYVVVHNNEVAGFTAAAGNGWGGGIAATGSDPTSDVRIIGNEVHGVSGVASPEDFGINVSGYRVQIRQNHVYNIGGKPNGGGASGNGILFNGAIAGLAEHNLVHDIGANENTCGGPGGIWAYQSQGITFRFNEVYNVTPVPAQRIGCDFIAFDGDRGTTNLLFEYNYAHDNAGACMIFFGASNTTFRYNICENNDILSETGAQVSISVGDTNARNYVYGNTIWTPSGPPSPSPGACYFFGFFYGTIYATIENNICYIGRGNPNVSFTTNVGGADLSGLVMQTNIYLAMSGTGSFDFTETGSMVIDAMLVAAGTGGICGTVTQTTGPQPCPAGYQLQPGSLALGAGTLVTGDGGRDYYGSPVANPPNIGAF